MTAFLKTYFDTEGPFGLPMKDIQAKALEERLKSVPKEDGFTLRRGMLSRGVTELQSEGRSDVSWITEETPDRVGDIVLARGMDDSHFRLNPLVTLNHRYDQAPVGRSVWRKRVREGTLHGIKAKTLYPPRPETWTGGDWPPDLAFDLVRTGLLRGKSIGFIPLKMRPPTQEEIDIRPELARVRNIVETWLLAEYACCYLPMNPHAVVESIDDPAAKAIVKSIPAPWREALELPETVVVKDLAAVARSTTCDASKPGKKKAEIDDSDIEAAIHRSWRRALGRV